MALPWVQSPYPLSLPALPSQLRTIITNSMSTVRLLVWIVIVIASLPAHAQFTLKLSPVSPGTAELQFSRTPGYYYRLEKSTDLNYQGGCEIKS